MEIQEKIQHAIDTLQLLKTDVSNDDEPSKERILAHLEALLNDFDEEIERNLNDLKEDCLRFVAGTINEDELFRKVVEYKQIYEYETGRVNVLRYVIDDIKRNFKLED